MALTDRQRALLQKVKYLGYERHFKPIFPNFGLDAPNNYAEFAELMAGTSNQALVEAVCAKVESVSQIGRPSITLMTCAAAMFSVDAVLNRMQTDIGVRRLLVVENLHETEYAIRTAEPVGDSLYVTVAFAAPPQVFPTWDEPQTVTPVNEMLIRYKPSSYYVAMIGRDRYAHNVARDLSSRFGLPVPNLIVQPQKRWFTNITTSIPDLTVRSVAGQTNHRIARRFALGAGQLEDIRRVTGNKIDNLDIEVEGHRASGEVLLMRVTFSVNGLPVTIAINLENDRIVMHNFVDLPQLEAVLLMLQQVLLTEGAA